MSDNTAPVEAQPSPPSQTTGASADLRGNDAIDSRELVATLARAADEAYSRAERDAPPRMPSGLMPASGEETGKPFEIRDAVERTSDWLELPEEERRSLASAHEEIQRRRDEAEKLGLTLEEREAILAGERAEQGPQNKQDLPQEWRKTYGPVWNAYKQLYPNHQPAEVAQRYIAIDQFIRRDPVAGINWLAQQYGTTVEAILAGAQPEPEQRKQRRSASGQFASHDWEATLRAAGEEIA